jgi:hypothetical protein
VITRVAVVPYPPLLVPELTVRAGAETELLRGACLRAVSSLTDSAAIWVALGVDHLGSRRLGPDTAGTFAGYGVDVPVTLGRANETVTRDPLLPLPALVAGWLRAQADAQQINMHLLGADTTPEECRRYGVALEHEVRAESVGMLVLADGTNCRNTRSPLPPDDRAEAFDEILRAALAEADPARLLGLDPVLAAELGVEGRAALQAMAAAVESAGGSWTAELLYSGTPFGVTYHVAVWSQGDH